MTLINRRSVLRGIVALPAVAALRAAAHVLPSSADESKTEVKICAPNPLEMNYVNLVLHGTWIYLIYHDHIQALAPKIESDSANPVAHVAGMGGSGGIQDVLPPGKYELSTVEAAPDLPPPDSWQSVVLDAKEAGITKIDLTNLYYSIRLPFPGAMAPVGQMKIRLKKGTGKLFRTTHHYLDKVLNRQGQRFPSVQVLTYRLTPKNKLMLVPDEEGCYSNACYPSLIAPPVPDSLVPVFRPTTPIPAETAQGAHGPIPFSSTYLPPSGDGYRQYHLAYVAHRREESGQHEDHSFSQMMSTLGIQVKSSFCDYHFDELPMSIPMGLTHRQVNLDDFPYEFEPGDLGANSVRGWYSEAEAEQFFRSFTSRVAAPALMAQMTVNQFLLDHSKPIGNCRSGHIIVTNPPAV